MLIYNHQKEFIGIDEIDLENLGFSSFAQLLKEADDFADLFVKKPGYIHNFKHVHWIDFISCAESSEQSRAIIEQNGRRFQFNIEIENFYLKQDPDSVAYSIKLQNLRVLSHSDQDMPSDSKPALDIDPDLYEPELQEIEDTQTISMDDFQLDEDEAIEIDVDDKPLDLEYDTQQESQKEPKEPLAPIYTRELEVGSDYKYNPQLASDELGLPLELIEEFIEDFIAQASDFKQELYSSLRDQDMDNVKILSHKLKGVAANLRIEDAFEVLTTVNTSEDFAEIEQSLDIFYEIVDRLSNKKDPNEQIETKAEPESESIAIELEEDKIELQDFEQEESKNEPQEQESEPEIQYDRARAASEIGIDIDNFNELFVEFVDEAKAYISDMQKALQDSSPKLYKKSSMKLKRMCETMRVDSFDKELEIIIGVEDRDEISKAIGSIKRKINLMSSMED